MQWSITSIIGIGLRLINNRVAVEKVVRDVIAHIVKSEEIYLEVRELVQVIAPELLPALQLGGDGQVKAIKTETYDVKWVQQALNHLLHPQVRLTVDGVMGEQTREAVRQYQQSRGLNADGWVGVLTMAQLDADIRGAHARTAR